MSMTRLPRQFLTSRVNEPRFHGRPQYTYGHTLTKTLTPSGIPSDFKIWWGKADTRQDFMVQLLLCNSKVPFKSPTLKLKAIIPFLYIFQFWSLLRFNRCSNLFRFIDHKILYVDIDQSGVIMSWERPSWIILTFLGLFRSVGSLGSEV